MFAARITVFALLVAGFSVALPQPSHAQTVTVTTPTVLGADVDKIERSFSLDYKNKQLAFHEDGKRLVFAKKVTTSTVGIRVETGAARSARSGYKITLRDGAGKMLWSDVLALKNRDGKNLLCSMNFNASTTGGIKLSLSANNSDVWDGDDSEDESENKFTPAVLSATMRSDNKLQKGEYASEDTRFRMSLLKDNTGLVFTQFKEGKWEEVAHASYDQKKQSFHGVVNGEKFAFNGVGKNSKTVRAVVNGKEVATATTADKGLVMSDGTTTVSVKAITQGGKKYTEVLWGGQRLLVQEGSFTLTNRDGVYILTPVNPPAPPASL